jgi:hypothetical protein
MPGMMLILGASRVSFQPGVDPFRLQPNGTPASDANMAQLLALTGVIHDRLLTRLRQGKAAC